MVRTPHILQPQPLRWLLTLGVLALLWLVPDEHHHPRPALPGATMGVCTGDCVSCGCPPELTARGDCCCVQTRHLRPQALTAPAIATTVVAADRLPVYRCRPCGRSTASDPVATPSLPLLPTAALDVALPGTGPLCLWAPYAERMAPHTILAPDPPPPEPIC